MNRYEQLMNMNRYIHRSEDDILSKIQYYKYTSKVLHKSLLTSDVVSFIKERFQQYLLKLRCVLMKCKSVNVFFNETPEKQTCMLVSKYCIWKLPQLTGTNICNSSPNDCKQYILTLMWFKYSIQPECVENTSRMSWKHIKNNSEQQKAVLIHGRDIRQPKKIGNPYNFCLTPNCLVAWPCIVWVSERYIKKANI